MIEHRAPVSGVAAHGGRLVATAGFDNQLILWDAQRKVPLSRSFHDHFANQVGFSACGRLVVSASSDHTARVWSLPDLKLKAVLGEHDDDVEMAAFDPAGTRVATASRDHHVHVYGIDGVLQARLEGHGADVVSVAWSPAGDELISASDDGTVKRWNAASGRLVEDIDLGGVEAETIAIGREGVVYAGNDDGEILVIDGNRRARCPAHAAGITRLVCEAGSGRLVSLSHDRSLRVWSTGDELRPLARSIMPAEIWPRACAFVDAGTLAFATFGSSYAVHHIDTDGWDLAGVRPTPGVNAVAVRDGRLLSIGDAGTLAIDGLRATLLGSLCNFLTPCGARVFTGGQMGRVMDALSGDLLHQHRSPLTCGAAFVRGGVPHVVVGTRTGDGLVFSLGEGGAVRLEAMLPLHANAAKAVAVSGDVLFAVCADRSAAWFSLVDFRETGRLAAAHEHIANGCAALPGGRFVSVGRDLKLRVWDTDHRATTLPTPHTRSIKCVATSADGRYVASASSAGVVAVLDMVSQAWVTVARPTTAGISSLCFDAAGSRFLAGSYDGQVYEIGVPL